MSDGSHWTSAYAAEMHAEDTRRADEQIMGPASLTVERFMREYVRQQAEEIEERAYRLRPLSVAQFNDGVRGNIAEQVRANSTSSERALMARYASGSRRLGDDVAWSTLPTHSDNNVLTAASALDARVDDLGRLNTEFGHAGAMRDCPACRSAEQSAGSYADALRQHCEAVILFEQKAALGEALGVDPESREWNAEEMDWLSGQIRLFRTVGTAAPVRPPRTVALRALLVDVVSALRDAVILAGRGGLRLFDWYARLDFPAQVFLGLFVLFGVTFMIGACS